MTSSNGSGRPSGCISIPVEIIRDSTPSGAGSQPRHESPFRPLHNESPYGGFADSPTWNTSMNAQPSSRFLPRQSPNPSYDRVIHNSQFNQPLNDRVSYQQYQEPQFRQPQQRMYQPGSANFSRSSEDLLNTPFDPMGYGPQPTFASLIPPSFGTGFRPESDFVHGNKFTSPLRRSYDALNDFADMHQSFPSAGPYVSEQQQQPQYRTSYQTQHQPQPQQQQQQQPTYGNQAYMNPNIVYTNQYGVPVDHHRPHAFQETGPGLYDRSRSPASQRGTSPANPPHSASQQQQQQQQQHHHQQQPAEEPELKMAKDTAGPIPMPAPVHSTTSQSTDQQVPSADVSAAANISSAPAPPPPAQAAPSAPEPARDPNTVALEKLEQIKQSLKDLDHEVDGFTGSTRNERAYKVLDEQALKIMMRCDELIDVSAEIKEKRKEMVRNVERLIAKLESKVPATPRASTNSNPMDTSAFIDDAGANNNRVVSNTEQETFKGKSSPTATPPKENLSGSSQQPMATSN